MTQFCDDHKWFGPDGGDCPSCESAFGSDWASSGTTPIKLAQKRIKPLPAKGVMASTPTSKADDQCLRTCLGCARRHPFNADGTPVGGALPCGH